MGRRPKEKPVQEAEDFSAENKKPESDLDLEAKKIVDEFKDEKAQEKKPRRRAKQLKEDIENENAFAQTATFSASIALNVIISRLPKNIPLNPEEKKAFDDSFTAFAKKYFHLIERFGVEATFISSLVFILIPRLEFKRKKNDRKNFVNIRQNGNGQDDVSQRVYKDREPSDSNRQP